MLLNPPMMAVEVPPTSGSSRREPRSAVGRWLSGQVCLAA
jgi:hypothetical protein